VQPLLKRIKEKTEKSQMRNQICDVSLSMFGNNLKRIRAQRGMTQGQVSELAKIHKRYYQDLEACLKTPSVAIAARLQRALQCDWPDLTKGL